MALVEDQVEQEEVEDNFTELDEEVLKLLGEDDSGKIQEFKFHPELVKRWKKVLARKA